MKKPYIMPEESGRASCQLEYDQTMEEMLKDDPERLELYNKLITEQILPEEYLAVLDKEYKK